VPFRKADSSVIWHWCYNCTNWPLNDFTQREDKPSICNECAASDSCSTCQRSVVLRAGVPSDSVLGAVLAMPP
jgi:hypothetical protein